MAATSNFVTPVAPIRDYVLTTEDKKATKAYLKQEKPVVVKKRGAKKVQ